LNNFYDEITPLLNRAGDDLHWFQLQQRVTPPVEIVFSITAAAGNNVTIEPSGITKVKKGESQTFTITIQDGYTLKSATIDGVEVTVVNSTITISNISTDKTLKVEAISNDIILLSKAPWYLKSIEVYEDNDFAFSLDLNDGSGRLTDKYYFYQTGKLEVFHANGVSFAGGAWSISGKVMTMGPAGTTYEIKELSEKSFSITNFVEVLPNGKSRYQKLTFGRP